MYKFFERSASYIVDIIMEDLMDNIKHGKKSFDDIGDFNINEKLSGWIDWFEEYPKDFSDNEIEFIEREIGEFLGNQFIWYEEEEERVEFKQKMFRYFGSKNGFYKLVVKIYDEMSKDELMY